MGDMAEAYPAPMVLRYFLENADSAGLVSADSRPWELVHIGPSLHAFRYFHAACCCRGDPPCIIAHSPGLHRSYEIVPLHYHLFRWSQPPADVSFWVGQCRHCGVIYWTCDNIPLGVDRSRVRLPDGSHLAPLELRVDAAGRRAQEYMRDAIIRSLGVPPDVLAPSVGQPITLDELRALCTGAGTDGTIQLTSEGGFRLGPSEN